jgi:Copper type II ascorbate-dependent monooxygenase, C-terminal domain
VKHSHPHLLVGSLLALGCSDNAPERMPAPILALDAASEDGATTVGAAADAGAPLPVGLPGAPDVPRDVSTPMVASDGAVVDAASVAGDPEYLGLAAPRAGFRLKTRGAMIPNGGDTEICEVAQLPGTPDQEYIIGTVELANGRSSHHLIVSVAEPGTAAERKLDSLPVGTQTPCVSSEIEFGQGAISVAGSQTPLNKYSLPAGVGMRLRGGQRIVFDYHYFNFTGAPVKAESAAAFHTLGASEVKNISTGFAFTNMTIDTPPMDEETFTASCRFKHDVMLQTLARHTHTKGTDFTVWFEGGAQHGQQIWQSLDWEHDQLFNFPAPILVKAGEGFKFACSFRNDGNAPLRFGIAAKDEMCILSGSIWSPTPGAEIDKVNCVATWIDGQGIGHDARDEGGRPPPAPDDLLACTLNTVGVGFLDSCVDCICGSCATPFQRCNEDADCGAIIQCRTGCPDGPGPACEESCEPVMFAHSGGVGMAAQMGECVLAECGSACAILGNPSGR